MGDGMVRSLGSNGGALSRTGGVRGFGLRGRGRGFGRMRALGIELWILHGWVHLGLNFEAFFLGRQGGGLKLRAPFPACAARAAR